MGFPFEHGLHSTMFAMRLVERLGVDRDRVADLLRVPAVLLGCTADAEVVAEVFGGDA